jgi:hypothetical protein
MGWFSTKNNVTESMKKRTNQIHMLFSSKFIKDRHAKPTGKEKRQVSTKGCKTRRHKKKGKTRQVHR